MLKKARLADQLNCQISNRPGPLELIKKNILHTEEPIERIVKEGLVSFKATSEGLLNRPQQPHAYVTYEDDSQSSEGDLRNTPPRTDVLECVTSTPPGLVSLALSIPTPGGPIVVSSPPGLVSSVVPLQPPTLQRISSTLIIPSQPATTTYVPPPPPPPPPVPIKIEPIPTIQTFKSDTSNLFAELCQSVTGTNSNLLTHHVASPISSLSPISSVSSPPSQLMVTCRQMPTSSNQSNKSDAPGKDKNRKKCKTKQVAKSRTIKFHEYKGPPNAQKNSSSLASLNEETSYQLLLKQQNFLLEYLEGLHKHPANILPANLKSIQAEVNTFQQNTSNFLLQPQQPSPAPSIASSIPASPAPSCTDSISSELSKLEKMKVSDLKLLLKKRNLPVSGPKPQLIERLRPFLPLEPSEPPSHTESIASETCDMETINSPHNSLSPDTSEHDSLMEVQQLDSPSPMGRATPHQLHHHNQHLQHNNTNQQSQHTNQNDEKLREQQRKIEELQRKLRQSQEELMHLKQTNTQPPPPLINSESGTVMRPDHTPPPATPTVLTQKMMFKQQLEAKIQKDKMMQRLQREHAAFQQVKQLQGNLIIDKHLKPIRNRLGSLRIQLRS